MVEEEFALVTQAHRSLILGPTGTALKITELQVWSRIRNSNGLSLYDLSNPELLSYWPLRNGDSSDAVNPELQFKGGVFDGDSQVATIEPINWKAMNYMVDVRSRLNFELPPRVLSNGVFWSIWVRLSSQPSLEYCFFQHSGLVEVCAGPPHFLLLGASSLDFPSTLHGVWAHLQF